MYVCMYVCKCLCVLMCVCINVCMYVRKMGTDVIPLGKNSHAIASLYGVLSLSKQV